MRHALADAIVDELTGLAEDLDRAGARKRRLRELLADANRTIYDRAELRAPRGRSEAHAVTPGIARQAEFRAQVSGRLDALIAARLRGVGLAGAARRGEATVGPSWADTLAKHVRRLLP